MKKGFTLIELLAVILILGIIALIAIPTVNNILKESRRGAFSSTLNNLQKAIEEKCTLEQIKNEEITTMYTITDGVITPNLDIKGDLPNGIIYVNKDCEVSYTLSDNNFTGSKEINGEVVISDKAPNNENIVRDNILRKSAVTEENHSGTDIQSDAYSDKIITLTFKNDKNVPENAVETWDMSEAGNNSIIGYIVKDETDPNYYHAYIGSDGIIYSNPDSSYMLAELPYLRSINFENFNTSKVTNMTGMFSNAVRLTSLDLSNFDTSNVTNMQGMFEYNTAISSLNVSNFNTSKVTNMENMFYRCSKLEYIDLSNFDASNVTTMKSMFYDCEVLIEIKTPRNITSTVNTEHITTRDYDHNYNKYYAGTFPVGITESITLRNNDPI